MGTVAPGMLFGDTEPPRVCPADAPKVPPCNLAAPNDNTFVNTVKLGDHFTTWTDSTHLSTIDPHTLNVTGRFNWTDDINHGKLHMGVLSSAHPIRRLDGEKELVTLQINPSVLPEFLHLGGFVDVALVNDDQPHVRSLVRSSKRLEHTPYLHSFGVSEDFVILPFTPLTYNMWQTIEGKPMNEAFQAHPGSNQTVFHLFPLNGSTPLEFTAPTGFTYSHVVNCYQNSTGVVFDATTWQDGRLYITEPDAFLSTQRNKHARDQLEFRKVIWRYHMHLSGPNKGSVSSEPVSMPRRLTDFSKVNPLYMTKKHCIYYAIEQFHNQLEYGSTAIVKHNTCTGKRIYWHQASTFPSEPYFINRPAAKAEDDGIVVFAATDGVTLSSFLVVLDGESFEPLVEQPVPNRISFSTHGEWFQGLIGNNSEPLN